MMPTFFHFQPTLIGCLTIVSSYIVIRLVLLEIVRGRMKGRRGWFKSTLPPEKPILIRIKFHAVSYTLALQFLIILLHFSRYANLTCLIDIIFDGMKLPERNYFICNGKYWQRVLVQKSLDCSRSVFSKDICLMDMSPFLYFQLVFLWF